MKTKDISDNPSDHINELSARDYLINALEANLAEKHEGVEQGIVDVSIDELPDPEGINGPEDFKKISAEQMKDGLYKLQEMKPTIDAGVGKNSDYWSMHDYKKGLDYPNGYLRVYEAFYGNDAIRLENFNNQWNIINGRHRIWLAKQMGIESLPANVLRQK